MLLFALKGIPPVQKQTQFVRSTGIAYNPSKKDLEDIQNQIRPYAPETPLEGAIDLDITFFLPIPKSVSNIMRTKMLNGIVLPTKRPDFDNLAYIVTNALKGIVYRDDSLVTDCKIRKRYSNNPGTSIIVRSLNIED